MADDSGKTAQVIDPGRVSSIADTIRDRREAGGGGDWQPAQDAPAPAQTEDRAIRAQIQGRDEHGRFVPKEPPHEVGDVREAVDADSPDPALQDQEEPQEEPQEDAEVHPEADTADAPPEDGEAPEPTVETDEEGWLTAELPPRREGEAPVVIETDDPEIAKRIGQLRAGYMRGSEFRRRMEQLQYERTDLQARLEMLQADPASYITHQAEPETRRDIALALLADEQIYGQVAEKLEEWSVNPELREAERARIERDQYKRQIEAMRQREHQEIVTTEARKARETVYSCIPDDVDDALADRFVNDCITDIQRFASRSERQVTAQDVPQIIAERLRLYEPYGFRATAPGAPNGSTRRPAKRPSAPKNGTAPRDTGKEVRDARARMRTVAATPAGTGGGTAATSLRPPPGTRLEDAFKYARGGRIRWGG